jgi:SPP1 gp7 family putative phage head morphogenesis protein
MTNPNNTLFDGSLRRRIALEAQSDAQARETIKFLEKLKADIVGKIAAAGDPNSYSVRQQRLLLASVEELHRDVYEKITNQLDSNFAKTARDQAAFEAANMRAATQLTVRGITATSAYQIAKARPLQGRFLDEMMADLEPGSRKRLTAALRLSFAEGESLLNASARIRETLDISERGLRTLIRTSNSHIASAVADATYKNNPDIVGQYEWRSTLDMRTTPICQVRDGQIYDVGKGPLPPAHFSCRSTTTAILKGFPPPDRVTYPEWLKRQSADVQNEVLGKKKAEAFRNGATLDKFVSKTGRTKAITKRLPRVDPRTDKDFATKAAARARGQAGFRRTSRKIAGQPVLPQLPKLSKTPTVSEIQARVAVLNRKAQEDVLAHGRRFNKEKAVVVDERNGEVFDSMNGKARSVSMSEKVSRELYDPEARLILHHNHPSSSSLSLPDILLAQRPGSSGVWAYGHEGGEYFVSVANKTASHRVLISKEYNRILKTLKPLMQSLYDTGVLTADDFPLVFGHVILGRMNRAGIVKYTAKLTGKPLAAYQRHKQLVDRLIEGTP